MTWQEVLKDWGLGIPSQSRIRRAEEEILGSDYGNPKAPIRPADESASWRFHQNIVVYLPNHPKATCCSCLDFKTRQMPKGLACKHITAMAMLVASGHLAHVAQRQQAQPQAPSATKDPVIEALEKALKVKADVIVSLLKRGKKPLLWGTTGTLKTSATHEALLRLNGKMGLEEAIGSESWTDADLVGCWTPSRKWVWGPMGRAFDRAQKGEKVLFFLDEVTRFNVRALDILMRAIQPMRRELAVAKGIQGIPSTVSEVYVLEAPLMGYTAWAPCDKLFWVLAGNPWVNPLDPALVRRCQPVEFGFDKSVAQAIPDRTVGQMVQVLWESYLDNQLPVPLEYQALVETAGNPKQMFREYLERVRVISRDAAESARLVIESTNRSWV